MNSRNKKHTRDTENTGEDSDDRDLDFSGVDIEGADPDGDAGTTDDIDPERTI